MLHRADPPQLWIQRLAGQKRTRHAAPSRDYRGFDHAHTRGTMTQRRGQKRAAVINVGGDIRLQNKIACWKKRGRFLSSCSKDWILVSISHH